MGWRGGGGVIVRTSLDLDGLAAPFLPLRLQVGWDRGLLSGAVAPISI
jgi:hypothetical protein